MAASSQQGVTERRLRPIYEAIDNMQYKKAVQLCDKVLKKQSELQSGRALKALALSRLQKMDEALVLVEQLVTEQPSDEGTLQAMTMYFRESGQTKRIPAMYEAAVKKRPKNDEILSHLFMAYVRTEDYKKQQQIALALYKVTPSNPYYSWAVMSIVMQAEQDPTKAKAFYLPLAERMLEKFVKEKKLNAVAEMRLYVMVLEMLGKTESVVQLLESPLAKLYTNSYELEMKVLECWMKLKRWRDAARKYTDLILHNPDRWSCYGEYMYCQMQRYYADENDKSPITEIKDFVRHVRSLEEAKNKGFFRAPFLAELELIKRLREAKLQHLLELEEPLVLLMEYFRRFSHKPCCYDDTHGFISKLLTSEDIDKYMKFVEETVAAEQVDYDCTDQEISQNVSKLTKHLYLVQMQRYLGKYDSLSVQDKLALINNLTQRHSAGLTFGRLLRKTEVQFSDVYVQLAAQLMLEIYQETNNVGNLWDTALMLELGWKKSRSNAQLQLMLLKIYGELGAFELCSELYDSLEIKSIQIDTLGYIASRYMQSVGTFLFANHFYSFALKFYKTCERETTECMVQAYRNGFFTKIPEMRTTYLRLISSHHYALVTVDQQILLLTTNANSLLTAEKVFSSPLLSPRYGHDFTEYFDNLRDNRDFEVFEDWQSPKRKLSKELIRVSFEAECLWLRILALVIKLSRGALSFLPTYSTLLNDFSQDAGTQAPPVEVFNEDLRMFEESVQAAETHESLSVFKTLRIPLVPVSQPPTPLLNLFVKNHYGQTLANTFKLISLFQELTQSATVDEGKFAEVKKLLETVMTQLTECSKKIPGIPDDVRKQFQDVIQKEMAPAGDAKPAICSEDANEDDTPETPLHPFDILRKTSIQFEPYVMFVQVSGFITLLCAVCAEMACPMNTTSAAAAKKKRVFKPKVLPAETNQLLLNFAGQLKFLMSELITRHPLFPNIADTAEFVESFSQLSINDKDASGKARDQVWLASATHMFREVVESYNSSLKSCSSILTSKQQFLDDVISLLNQHHHYS